MTIYEIDEQILQCIDQETGEIIDASALDALQLQRNVKLEGVACWIKELNAEAVAIKFERENLEAREKIVKNKSEQLKRWLCYALNGEKFKTAKVAISYRKSKSINVENESAFILWAKEQAQDLLTYKEPAISRTAVRQAIEDGKVIPGASIVENTNIVIK